MDLLRIGHFYSVSGDQPGIRIGINALDKAKKDTQGKKRPGSHWGQTTGSTSDHWGSTEEKELPMEK